MNALITRHITIGLSKAYWHVGEGLVGPYHRGLENHRLAMVFMALEAVGLI